MKPHLLFFCEPGCPYSARLNAQLLYDAGVKEELKRFLLEVIECDPSQEEAHRVSCFPTLLAYSPHGEERGRWTGCREPEALSHWLRSLLP